MADLYVTLFIAFGHKLIHQFRMQPNKHEKHIKLQNNGRVQQPNTNNMTALIDSFKDHCAFKANINRRQLYELLTQNKFANLLKRKVSLQCHPQQKNCLAINFKEFNRPKKILKPIGRVIQVDNSITIDLDDDDPQTTYGQIPEQHLTQGDRLIELLSSIRSSFAYKVQLLGDESERVLKTIVNITFVQLSILHIGYCNLATIEPLNTLYAPNLRVFNFEYNRLTDLRVIRKIQCKKIKYVNAVNYEPEGCPFGQMYYLTRHYPHVSLQILKGKHESAYYQNKPLWRQYFRKAMRLFQAMPIEQKPQKKRFHI